MRTPTALAGGVRAASHAPPLPSAGLLAWPLAWPALVWGLNAHRKWHYTRDGQPPFVVRWFIRFRLWSMYEVSIDLWTRLVCMLTCTEMPWHAEAREAAEEDEEEKEKEEHEKKQRGDSSPIIAENTIFASWESSQQGSDAEEEEEEEDEETAEDVRFKRNVVAMGFAAVYVSWVSPSSAVYCAGFLTPPAYFRPS